jgi:cation:H+ antiporter
VALITGMDAFLRSAPDFYDRSDGLVFLLIFCVFMFYTINDVIRKRGGDPFLDQAEEFSGKKSFKKISLNLALFSIGLILLVYGGKVSVDAAVTIAQLLDVPRVIIGLTIIAVGTSLPELVTSIIATWKGHTDIAIGNIVGSNIFNLLFINGICASIKPIPIPAGGNQDLFMMVFLSLFLLPMCITDNGKLVRKEGIVLLIAYVGFSMWRVFSS